MARSKFSVKEGISVADSVTETAFDLIPVGTVLPYAGSTAPDGWLLCDGSSVSRNTYPNLHALLAVNSYPFGNGDGSTTFTLPDMRGRMPLGAGDSPDANVPSVRTLGQSSGKESHTITTGDLPVHTHTVDHDHGSANTGNNSVDHSHSIAHDHGSANTGNQSANHTHTIDHDHSNANTGNVSADHSHSTDYNSHAHAIWYNTDAAAGTAKARATAAGNTLGNPGATDYQGHSHGTGGFSSNHYHGFDMPNFAGSSGSNSANHSHAFDMPAFAGNSGNVSANHTHAFDMPAFTGSSGDGGFANTAVNIMNPFLVLTYIIKY